MRVTNVGAASYTGPVNIHDEIDLAGSFLGTWAPAPEWTCGPVGAIGFDCTHPVVTLAPGDFVEVVLWIAAPPIAPGLRPCPELRLDRLGRRARRLQSRQRVRLRHHLPLSARPSRRDRRARHRQGCRTRPATRVRDPEATGFAITASRVTNIGGAPYLGPIEIADIADIAAVGALGREPGALDLRPGHRHPGPRTCSRPGVPGGLQPGDSVESLSRFRRSRSGARAERAPQLRDRQLRPRWRRLRRGLHELRDCADLPARRTLFSGPRDPQGPAARSLLPGVPLPVHASSSRTAATFPIRVRSSSPTFPIPGSGRSPSSGRSDVACVPAGPSYTCTWPHDICRPHSGCRIRHRVRDPAGASRAILHQLRHGAARAQQQHRHQRRGLRGRLRAVPRPRAVQPVDLPARVELHARRAHRQQGAACPSSAAPA